MNDDTVPKTRRFSLHVTLSIAFTSLLSFVGAALIGFHYVESRRAALLGAEDLMRRVDRHMRASVSGLYGPAQNVVDLSSKTLPASGPSPTDRLDALGYATEILRIKREMASLFVGYDNGDFYLARYLDETRRARFAAPEGATFALDAVRPDEHGAFSRHRIFYDADLVPIGDVHVDEQEPFDARTREWYRLAMNSSHQIASSFYVFHTTGEIGVTLARRLAGDTGVVGVDLTLAGLIEGLSSEKVTPGTRVAMLEPDGRVIALSDQDMFTLAQSGNGDRNGVIVLPELTELGDPVYEQLARRLGERSGPGRFDMNLDGRTWMTSISQLPNRHGDSILLATLIPQDELLANVERVRDRSLLVSLALLATALLVVIGLSRHVSGTLRALASGAEDVRRLKLDTRIDVRSRIREVDQLTDTMVAMKSSVEQFLAISHGLSSEKDFDRLLQLILDEARRVTGARGGAILLRSDDGDGWNLAIRHPPRETGGAVSESTMTPDALDEDIDRRTVEQGTVVRVDAADSSEAVDLTGIAVRFDVDPDVIRAVLSVPLRTSQGTVIGLLQLINAHGPGGEAIPFFEETVPYVEALSSDAAVALDNRRLLQAQKDLLESFIHVVAGAIDAKSPYTHGHCQRVPEIATLLAEEAHACRTGPLASFRLGEDERWALHLASWLHDCGKVTTPEYVVDKATKLETLYNRIHEIRMRFEVLWRDAEIAYLSGVRERPNEEHALRRHLHEEWASLRDDFAFVAGCNTGDEPMTDERIARIGRIAGRTWRRNLDDTLGLSHGERARRDGAETSVPVDEPLLADRPEHIVPREPDEHPFGDGALGFRMDVPDHLYNRGEIHNLCVPRGTLTPEERFKINEHVIQTLRMLDRLPFPSELRCVPDWAGNHHERLDGNGYPRRLDSDRLSVPERVMAIADVFEALTATDRPYMTPKTLSKALSIMRSMCDAGHLCPDLFELFVRSGTHLRYAEKHLRPDQIDAVDVSELLGDDADGRPAARA